MQKTVTYTLKNMVHSAGLSSTYSLTQFGEMLTTFLYDKYLILPRLFMNALFSDDENLDDKSFT